MSDCSKCHDSELDADGYCSFCGHQENVPELVVAEMHSRRVPGVRSAAELERVARIYGRVRAAEIAARDAFEEALGLRLPDEQRASRELADADHYAMGRDW